mmetsp:Transcript_7194/g.11387  ORF Transcript_7194/g.11387 Transcript_7194/m.11387 type:complete len:248 (+) Transcript_7194:71-814(+)
MRLLLCRHGETVGNRQRILQGQSDGCLTFYGLKQAELLGSRLKSEKFTAVYVSDLARARQTAEPIAQYHPYVTPKYDPRLREKHEGILEGKPWGATRVAKAGSAPKSTRHSGPDGGGESWQDVVNRAESFFHELINCFKHDHDACVLVVSHGGYLRELIGLILRLGGIDNPPPLLGVRNTALFEFHIEVMADATALDECKQVQVPSSSSGVSGHGQSARASSGSVQGRIDVRILLHNDTEHLRSIGP